LTEHKIPFFIWKRYLEPRGTGSQDLLSMISTTATWVICLPWAIDGGMYMSIFMETSKADYRSNKSEERGPWASGTIWAGPPFDVRWRIEDVVEDLTLEDPLPHAVLWNWVEFPAAAAPESLTVHEVQSIVSWFMIRSRRSLYKNHRIQPVCHLISVPDHYLDEGCHCCVKLPSTK
jgi:hypothetical protein